MFADLPTAREIRFAFWGSEEQGLIGSNYYVNNLRAAELVRYIGHRPGHGSSLTTSSVRATPPP